MTDIVERLRQPWFTNGCEAYQLEAAAEIERLRKHAEAMAGAIGLHLYLNNEERPAPYEEPEDSTHALLRARLSAYRAEYPEEK